ncbi:catecholate siderophore receptor Fiu [Sinimarinibacterium sp. CAU 1509]|uniref:catecholate siderophore receptor Fiu n=1 Tax=Sinimarinibacterium sp. CAU 1509 TaxID=2562283 RepID=UPI0010AC2E5F|nr:catecholate siderophore receptor Fiu [Sinimarinibacterium sp. CAU 1509]TJY56602.1 catecholate siderophore receptor Fiu [Sinimarinibacterium sp. CAU 1509]
MEFRLSRIAAAMFAAYALPAVAQQTSATTTTADTAAAAAAKDQATQLPEIKVEANGAAPYKADAVQSTKFTQPLRDTPQTIQVITSDLFSQQGATTLTEALRNSPAVGTFYAGENGNTATGDAVYMRGFDTSSSIFVDGVRDLGSISRDVFNIDQIEVEKGPAGTDNGRSAPTGAINLVSKQALLGNAVSGSVSIGTDGQQRATADLNQTLGDLAGSALRLNVLWQDSEVPGRDHVENKRTGIAPSLGFGLGGATRAYVNLLYVQQDNIPDGFVPTIGLPGWTPQPGLEPLAGHPVDPENFYGTRDDHDSVTAQMATVRFEHDFSDALKLSNIARWGQTTQDYLLTAFMTTSALDEDGNPTGNVQWTDPDDLSTYTFARSLSTFRDQQNRILADQLNLRVDIATGGITHNLSAGVEITREEQTTHSISSSGSRPATSLYDPDWSQEGDLSWSRNGAGAEGQTDTISLYVFDTLKFGSQFLVTGGLRADRYETEYRGTAVCNDGSGRGAVSCNGAPIGTIVETIDAQADDTLINWKLGAVYKPLETGSFYANYAISQQPPGGANFQLSTSASNLNNPNMDPQKAETIEVGTKWDLLDEALTVNLALFRTNVTNEINTQVTDDDGNPTQTGEKRVEGVELSAVGSITENWSVSAGYTHMKTSVEEGATVAVDGTSNLTYTPDDAFTGWSTYRFPFGLTVGAGARYSDGLHRGNDGAVGTPTTTESYTVYDAVVSYAATSNVVLRVNGYNLSDEEYVASINKSGYRYTPGTPRTFLISADFRF